jgi:hypothetical protein
MGLGDWRTHDGRRRLENQIDAAIAAARAHHPLPQAGKRHIASSGPSQRLEAQLGLMVALGRRARVGDDAPKASRMNAPSGRKRFAKSLYLHENIWRTSGMAVKRWFFRRCRRAVEPIGLAPCCCWSRRL